MILSDPEIHSSFILKVRDTLFYRDYGGEHLAAHLNQGSNSLVFLFLHRSAPFFEVQADNARKQAELSEAMINSVPLVKLPLPPPG